jgi:hypothetical protein
MTVTFPILTLGDGEEADPAWFADITDTVNDHEDRVAALESVAWTTYTPGWTSTGTAPVIGINGTLTGRYREPPGTGLIVCEVAFIAGAATTFGTGEYRFTLPLDAAATATSFSIGAAWLLDSGVTERSGVVRVLNTTQVSVISPTGPVAATVPWTWNVSDQIRFQVTYDAA